MTERFMFIVFASVTSNLMNPIVIIVASLVLVIVIVVAALFLLRNSGKNKAAKADKGVPASDWQRQGQQANAPGAWNQPGAPADWAQQQPGAWGAQSPAQQPGTWSAQTPGQQQPGAWGAQSPAQQPGAWGAQTPGQQQQPGVWGGQSSSPQQPAANAWGAQSPAQQPGTWGTQTPGQQQQPGVWADQSSSPQQPAEWGAAPSSTPSAGAGKGGNQPAWGQDATLMPQKSAQDSWGQSQAPSQQQDATPWGMPGNSPSQPQAPTGYGGSGSGQSWQQSGQPAANKDPWGQPAQAQPPAWGQQPFQQPASSSPPPTAGNAAIPSWQQGPAQGQGFGAPGMQPDAAPMFGTNDNDKTMLRPSGPQGSLGTVRVEEGKEPGRVYEVRKDELSIGRSRESDIFLEDLAVSRLHAKIVNLGNGNYALKDEGSANGTKVNGQLVNKYQTYPLQEGDKIQLGQTVLVFAKR